MNARLMQILVACALGALALAQNQTSTPRSPEELRAELDACKRSLDQQRTEAERLLDLRIRHELGLPTEAELEWSRPVTTVTLTPGKAPERQLAEEEAATSLLRSQIGRAHV